ncbi:MAG TPA: M56 family metallopeptidase [Longimicrobium sp.]|nr:M56 family metallopeptidase [Longimicrobium sp.]
MIAWMAFAAAVAMLAGIAALAAERALILLRLPARGAWAAALAASLVLPFALPRPAVVEGGGPASAALAPGSDLQAIPVSPAPVTPSSSRPGGPLLHGQVEAVLRWTWGASTLAVAAWLAVSALWLARRRRAWAEATMAGERVLVSPSVGPAVVGFVRPRIVMPRWTLAWDEPLQRLMLRHEREHLRAGDPLLLLAGLVAAALMPWSPAVWWQLRRLRLAMEVDCDARTLRATGDVQTYGRLLLDVGRRGGAGAPVPLAAFSEPSSFLERRINAMTLRAPLHRGRRVLAWASVTAMAAVSLAALPAPARAPLLPASSHRTAMQADTERVYMLREVDRLPEVVNSAEMSRLLQRTYPQQMRDAGIEGVVTVEMVVGADGLPRSPAVITASRPEFREAALAVVNTARFRPAAKDGHAVRVKLSLPIAFQMAQPETAR